jgi:hypothetical protein
MHAFPLPLIPISQETTQTESDGQYSLATHAPVPPMIHGGDSANEGLVLHFALPAPYPAHPHGIADDGTAPPQIWHFPKSAAEGSPTVATTRASQPPCRAAGKAVRTAPARARRLRGDGSLRGGRRRRRRRLLPSDEPRRAAGPGRPGPAVQQCSRIGQGASRAPQQP